LGSTSKGADEDTRWLNQDSFLPFLPLIDLKTHISLMILSNFVVFLCRFGGPVRLQMYFEKFVSFNVWGGGEGGLLHNEIISTAILRK